MASAKRVILNKSTSVLKEAGSFACNKSFNCQTSFIILPTNSELVLCSEGRIPTDLLGDVLSIHHLFS